MGKISLLCTIWEFYCLIQRARVSVSVIGNQQFTEFWHSSMELNPWAELCTLLDAARSGGAASSVVWSLWQVINCE